MHPAKNCSDQLVSNYCSDQLVCDETYNAGSIVLTVVLLTFVNFICAGGLGPTISTEAMECSKIILYVE